MTDWLAPLGFTEAVNWTTADGATAIELGEIWTSVAAGGVGVLLPAKGVLADCPQPMVSNIPNKQVAKHEWRPAQAKVSFVAFRYLLWP
ncbi:MAG: hypothetical protein ACRD2Q_02425 [Terriglobales bacterium]